MLSIGLMVIAPLASRQLQSGPRWVFAMNVIGRCLLVGCVAATALVQSSRASPGNWPERVVKFLLPAGPGSSIDVAARLFAERLSERWGKPIVVENRPGADGILGVQAFL